MPESKVRKTATEKRRTDEQKKLAEKRQERARLGRMAVDRSWVPWVFIPVGLLGVIWLIVYYLAGPKIPFLMQLGNWNILIGLGLFAAALGIATLWK